MYDKTHHQIVHHYPYFNLFMLHSNSIDNQEIQVNKNKTFFFVSTYCPLPKLSNVQVSLIV